MATQKQNWTTQIVPVAAGRKKSITDIVLKVDAAQHKGPRYKSGAEKIKYDTNLAYTCLTRNMVYRSLHRMKSHAICKAKYLKKTDQSVKVVNKAILQYYKRKLGF